MKPVSIVTANLDFALRPELVGQDLKRITRDAEIITFQEGKNVDVDVLIKDPKWNVFQKLKNEAKQGSGVAWLTPRIKSGNRGQRIGVTPHGRGLLTRYITWVDLRATDETGEEHVIRVASVHLPPMRFWAIYPFMLVNLYAFAKATRKPVIFGGDWNKLVRHADDLHKLAKRIGGSFHGKGIDGFLFVGKGKWKLVSVGELYNTHSDHNPVRIKITPII